jgi:hypothetical protein
MIQFIDDFGCASRPRPGNAEEAARLNAALEARGMEEMGYWVVVDDESLEYEASEVVLAHRQD